VDAKGQNERIAAAMEGLAGIGAKDEIEGQIAAQMLACHFAAMEGYRRAMLSNQTFEGSRESLTQANKLSRTHATLVEALNRHRGKGQQKVTVEHVHVHAGGRAIVGAVSHQGGGAPPKTEDQPHAKQLADAPSAPMLCKIETEREAAPVTGG
jgi:hypothetical protein